jgi:glutaredoxin
LTATVTVFGARGCHLCENALRVVERVRAELPFELEHVDITGDDELERLYRERLPVVFVNGQEAFTYFVHPAKLREKVVAAASETP